jgi:hypothetical protein
MTLQYSLFFGTMGWNKKIIFAHFVVHFYILYAYQNVHIILSFTQISINTNKGINYTRLLNEGNFHDFFPSSKIGFSSKKTFCYSF